MDTVYYLDTNVIIAIVELTSTPEPGQRAFADAMQRGDVDAVTSEFALAECLVVPFGAKNLLALNAYAEFFNGGAVVVAPVSRDILVRAAQLRAETQMKLGDAIHVATAEAEGCRVLISEDRRMRVPDGMRLARWTRFIREG